MFTWPSTLCSIAVAARWLAPQTLPRGGEEPSGRSVAAGARSARRRDSRGPKGEFAQPSRIQHGYFSATTRRRRSESATACAISSCFQAGPISTAAAPSRRIAGTATTNSGQGAPHPAPISRQARLVWRSFPSPLPAPRLRRNEFRPEVMAYRVPQLGHLRKEFPRLCEIREILGTEGYDRRDAGRLVDGDNRNQVIVEQPPCHPKSFDLGSSDIIHVRLPTPRLRPNAFQPFSMSASMIDWSNSAPTPPRAPITFGMCGRPTPNAGATARSPRRDRNL